MDEDYISLDEALAELGISESELRAMISRGQLRVFGKAGEEKFRRSAIENLKRAGESQPTLILDDDQDSADEEPLPLISDDEPLPIVDEEPAAVIEDEPAPVVEEEQTVVDEPVAQEDDRFVIEEPTEDDVMPLLADEDDSSDTIMPTIELAPEDQVDIPSIDEEHTEVATQEVSLADDDFLILDEEKSPTVGMGNDNNYAAPQAPSQYEEEEEEPVEYVEDTSGSGGMGLLLGVLSLAMLLSLFVFVGAAFNVMPKGLSDQLTSIGSSIGLATADDVNMK